ncbi:hypothetical protein M3P21_02210 [Ruegeria sp. 2012CJ41-6]|uniref:Uncharacterized protein n=1 Tax=Ruegeria spongiae TaxID=2942209 RepID=A0ABT0PXJ4_9RHOB|nr:hypothetical protein [Ruegeria spongiae]MCL6282329.1 hypothetical protein [Ruegeria spongiae]
MKLQYITTTKNIIGASLFLSLLFVLIGYHKGDISDQFSEGKPGTIVSVLLLLAISVTCFRIYILRRRTAANWLQHPSLVWLLIASGFLFLALDDALKIHEGIDKSIHAMSEMTETSFSDRLDDAIIGVYALIGAIVLYVFRSELTLYRFLAPYLLAGFAVLILSIALDTASNGPGFALWVTKSESAAHSLHAVLETLEEVCKLLAEAIFLSGFLLVLQAAAEQDKS